MNSVFAGRELKGKVKVYRMEDLRIRFRVGRSIPTGSYEVTRLKTLRAVTKYSEKFETDSGNFAQEKWYEIARSCVDASESNELFSKIVEHCRSHCAWLKNDKDIEEYALKILIGRIYRHWKNFSADGLTENSAYIFEFTR